VSISAVTLQGWFKEELRIEKRFEKRGKVSIFLASSGEGEELLFVVEAKEIGNAHRELEKLLAIRKEMHCAYLASIAQYGFLSNGAFFWSYDLGTSSSFQNLFEEWPQNPLRLMRLISHAVAAIRVTHESGYFHGDLRMRNLWLQLREDGSENLLVVGEQIGLWSEKVLLENGDMSVDEAYCTAPEIAAGEAMSSAADIYALGVLLYRAVIGTWPFDGENAWEITAAHATEPLVRPQTQPPLHDDLWAIIEKSLRKDPSERLGIQEFAQALQLFAGYEKAMFLEIEEVDIAEPSPQPTIARQSSPVFKGLPPDHNVTVSSLDFVPVPKRLIANSALEKKVSKPKFKTKVQPVKPSDTAKEVTQPQDPPSNIPEKEEESRSPIPVSTMPLLREEEASEDVTEQIKVPPLQILVGARPMPASSVLETENTDKVEETSPGMPVTVTFDEASEETEKPLSSQRNRPRSKDEVRRVEKGIETYQFIILMVLSSVCTVILLKIAEKIF